MPIRLSVLGLLHILCLTSCLIAQQDTQPTSKREDLIPEPVSRLLTVAQKDGRTRPTFRLDLNSGHITVPVTIANQTFQAAFDTGSSISVVDRALQPLLGKKVADANLSSGALKVRTEVFECPDFRLESLKLPFVDPNRPAIVSVWDMKDARDASRDNIDVIIGVAHFMKARMQVNFDTKTLRFLYRDDDFIGESINVKFSERGTPSIVGRIADSSKGKSNLDEPVMPNAGEEVHFLVDTGFSECLGLRSGLFDRLVKRGDIRLLGTLSAVSFRGHLQQTRLGRLRRLTIGDFTIDNLTVIDSRDAGLNVIGVSLLSRFLVTFVFPRSQMFLAPGTKFDQPDLTGIQGFGVFFQPKNSVETRRNHLTVVSIDPDGPAEKTGLKEKDVIERIDDHEFEGKSLFQIIRSFEKPGQDLKLRIRRGEETRDITIAIPKVPPGMFALDGSAATHKTVK